MSEKDFIVTYSRHGLIAVESFGSKSDAIEWINEQEDMGEIFATHINGKSIRKEFDIEDHI